MMQIIEGTGKHVEEYFFDLKPQIDIHKSINHHISSSCLLNIRRVACVLLTIVLIMIQRVDTSFLEDLMFLSEQGFILTWLYFLLILQHHHISSSNHLHAVSKIGRVIQVIFEIALCFQVPITIIEWSLLFEDELQTEATEQIIVEVLEHSTPLIFLLLDLIANSYRFPRRRLILILAYGIAYLAINLGYSLSQEPVYDIITWQDAESYIYVLAVILLIIATHFAGRAIYIKFKMPQGHEGMAFSLHQRQYEGGSPVEDQDIPRS